MPPRSRVGFWPGSFVGCCGPQEASKRPPCSHAPKRPPRSRVGFWAGSFVGCCPQDAPTRPPRGHREATKKPQEAPKSSHMLTHPHTSSHILTHGHVFPLVMCSFTKHCYLTRIGHEAVLDQGFSSYRQSPQFLCSLALIEPSFPTRTSVVRWQNRV